MTSRLWIQKKKSTHKLDDKYLASLTKRIKRITLALLIGFALLVILLTNRYEAIFLILLYKAAAKLILVFIATYLDDKEAWKEWQIEKTDEGLRFHHKNTGRTIKFTDLRRIQVSKNQDMISSLTLELNNMWCY